MAFFDKLKSWVAEPQSKTPAADVNVLRDIISKVEELPQDRAHFIACFAFLLGRVAYSDLKTSNEEVGKMEALIKSKFEVDESQAVLICKMARTQNELFGSTENYIVAREFKELTTPQERKELIDFLFQIAAADESISSSEETEINQMASELEIHRDDLIAIRQKYRAQREVFK